MSLLAKRPRGHYTGDRLAKARAALETARANKAKLMEEHGK